MCQSYPEGTLHGGNTGTAMYGPISFVAFAGLVEKVQIGAVIKGIYEVHKCGHSVVLGPNGFHLCSYLIILQCGMPCRFFFAAAVTYID